MALGLKLSRRYWTARRNMALFWEIFKSLRIPKATEVAIEEELGKRKSGSRPWPNPPSGFWKAPNSTRTPSGSSCSIQWTKRAFVRFRPWDPIYFSAFVSVPFPMVFTCDSKRYLRLPYSGYITVALLWVPVNRCWYRHIKGVGARFRWWYPESSIWASPMPKCE